MLLLYIVQGINQSSIHPDRWKLQKTTFICQSKLQDKKINALTYSFYRDKHGPMTTGIYDDTSAMIDCKYMANQYDPRMRYKGIEFLKECSHIFNLNKTTMQVVNSILEMVQGLTGENLKKLCYEYTVDFFGMKVAIKNLSIYSQILPKFVPNSAKFIIPDDELDDLLLALNPKLCEGLRIASHQRATKLIC